MQLDNGSREYYYTRTKKKRSIFASLLIRVAQNACLIVSGTFIVMYCSVVFMIIHSLIYDAEIMKVR